MAIKFRFPSQRMRGTLVLIAIGSFLTLLCASCNSAKYAVGYKQAKKSQDSYLLLKPIVTILTTDGTDVKVDSSFSRSRARIIQQTITDLLSKKFRVAHSEAQEMKMASLDSICLQIDKNDPKILRGMMITPVPLSDRDRSEKFGLLITMDAYINSNFGPHQNITNGIGSNTLVLNPRTNPMVALRVLVVDLTSNEVVFYDKQSTRNYDPRVESELQEFTRSALKKIYYK